MRVLDRTFIILLALSLVATSAFSAMAQAATPAARITRAGFLTPGVPLVTADLSLVDTNGSFLGGLTATDFEVLEDNKPIPAGDIMLSDETAGLAVVIVLDTGANITDRPGVIGAKRWSDLHDVTDDRNKNGLINELIKYRLTDPEDWIGLVGVGQEVGPVVAPERDQNKALNAVIDMQPYNRQTPLRAGIDQALNLLTSPGVPDNVQKMIFVFSDGIDVTKSPDEFVDLIRNAVAANIIYHTIGMKSPNSTAGYDSTGLERLAKQTGGAFTEYGSLDQRTEVLALFDRLATQRQQYRLSYQTHAAQGQHELRVSVNTADGKIETKRASFVSPLKLPTIKIVAFPPSLDKNGTVTITPTWTVTDGYGRDPAKIEYLVDGKIISTVTTLTPFVWDTSGLTEPDGHVFSLDARAYDPILVDASPAMSNPESVTVNNPTPVKVRNWLLDNLPALLLVPVVIILLILLLRMRKRIATGIRTMPSKVRTLTQRLGPAKAKLVVIRGANMGQEFLLMQQKIRLGRGEGLADIVLSDPSISSVHAQITEDQMGYWVADLGSTNHTFVNNQPIQDGQNGNPGQPVLVAPGGVIRLGAVELRLVRIGGVTRVLGP